MNILFDLDGTLTDSSEGITNCIKYALQKLGYEVPEHEVLLSCIGPPLITSLQTKLGVINNDDAQQAVRFYRERYINKGYKENKLYPGIMQCLKNLNELGHGLFVATAKPQNQVKPILDYFDITQYFIAFHGVDPNSAHSDKTGLIAKILKEESLDNTQTAMIGDRKFDVIGAVNNNVIAIGAGYGYGDNEELKVAGSDYIVGSPNEIKDLILALCSD